MITPLKFSGMSKKIQKKWMQTEMEQISQIYTLTTITQKEAKVSRRSQVTI